MQKKHIASIFAGIIMASIALVGYNTQESSLVPDKIMTKVMAANNKPKSYYGESKTIISENNKITEENNIKEWMDFSEEKMKSRSETNTKGKGISIATNDGQKIIMYMKDQNKALTTKALNDQPFAKSQREQIMSMLNFIKKSHNISTVGEETVNKIKTIHLKATPKEKGTMLGEIDTWIDKDNWFIVKIVSHTGNIKTEFEYTKINFSPKFDKNLFTQTIPSNVKLENLDNTIKNKENEKSATLEEGTNFIGKPILYIDKSQGYTMEKIKIAKYGSKIAGDEVLQSYEKDNKPAFTISVRKQQKQEQSGKIPGEKDTTIRKQKGTIMNDGIRILCWNEKDVSYTFIIDNPKIDFDEAKKVIENMVFTK